MATNWYHHYQIAQPLIEVWKCHGDWLSRRADGAGMEGTVTTPTDSRSTISLPATSGSHISLSHRMERSSMKCDESDYSAHHGLWSHLYTRVSYSLHLSLSSFSSRPVILAYHLSTHLKGGKYSRLCAVWNYKVLVVICCFECQLGLSSTVYTLDCLQIVLWLLFAQISFADMPCWYWVQHCDCECGIGWMFFIYNQNGKRWFVRSPEEQKKSVSHGNI